MTQKSNEYAAFSDVLRKVLSVSHSELKRQIAEEKEKRKPKASASDRVSREKN
jgi:hypothetical protein